MSKKFVEVADIFFEDKYFFEMSKTVRKKNNAFIEIYPSDMNDEQSSDSEDDYYLPTNSYGGFITSLLTEMQSCALALKTAINLGAANVDDGDAFIVKNEFADITIGDASELVLIANRLHRMLNRAEVVSTRVVGKKAKLKYIYLLGSPEETENLTDKSMPGILPTPKADLDQGFVCQLGKPITHKQFALLKMNESSFLEEGDENNTQAAFLQVMVDRLKVYIEQTEEQLVLALPTNNIAPGQLPADLAVRFTKIKDFVTDLDPVPVKVLPHRK